MTPAKRLWLLFFLGALFTYFYGIGNYPFLGPDEPRYARVAREMFERGDLVTPTLGGHYWFEKPALPYWVMIAAFRAFGVSEWSARLGFALMGIITALLIYCAGRAIERACQDETSARLLGATSGVAALTSAGLIAYSHGVNFDTPLTLMTTLALSCFIVYEVETQERRKSWWLAGFYVGVGASLLAKGLIGIIITFGVVGAYFVLRREWPGRRVMKSLLWGIPLALSVAALWYGPVIARHGWSFVEEFFVQHHFARYTSNKYHHPQPFYFYLAIMALFALPWTPYLVAAMGRARRDWSWRAPDALNKLRVFALAWMIVPVLFFSLSGSKLPGYVLPALPGAALLVGERLARLLRGEGRLRSMRATGALMVLLGGMAVVFIVREDYASRSCAIAVAAPLVVGGLVALVLAERRWLAFMCVASSMFVMTIVGLNCGVHEAAQRVSVAHALEKAAARGYGNAPLHQLHMVERTAEYYAADRITYGADGEPVKFEGVQQVRDAALASGGTVLVLVPTEFVEQLTTYQKLETEIINEEGGVTLVAARARE